MRTNDTTEAKPWQPLGEKVVKPAPASSDPEWKQRPGAAPGVEENARGDLRTNIPVRP